MVLRALGDDDAELEKRDRVTTNSIRNHTVRHFPVQQVARATYREILERRATDDSVVDFIEGVATAVTPLAGPRHHEKSTGFSAQPRSEPARPRPQMGRWGPWRHGTVVVAERAGVARRAAMGHRRQKRAGSDLIAGPCRGGLSPTGCRHRVAARLHQEVEHVAVLVDRAPQVMGAPLIFTNSSSKCHLSPGRGPRRHNRAA